MKVYSGKTSKQIGTMDDTGEVTTADRGLTLVMQEIDRRGFVTPFVESVEKEGGGVRDKVDVVEKTNPNYISALANVLERNGFIVVSSATD